MAAHATIPVINALSDMFHPCQALADFFTLEEKFGSSAGLKLAYVGDGNNVCHSLMFSPRASARTLRIATPAGYEPDAEFWRMPSVSPRETRAKIELFTDPQKPSPARKPFTPMCGPAWALKPKRKCARRFSRRIR